LRVRTLVLGKNFAPKVRFMIPSVKGGGGLYGPWGAIMCRYKKKSGPDVIKPGDQLVSVNIGSAALAFVPLRSYRRLILMQTVIIAGI